MNNQLKHIIGLVIISVLAFPYFGQEETDSLSRKPISFSFEKFMEVVSTNHPMIKQADILQYMGEANLMKRKGAFDPKVFSDVNQKYFDNKKYYSLIDAGLKIPAWYGIDIQTGYETNEGIYLSPDDNVADNGLFYAGVSLSLGKGLFINERMAELKKAKLFNEISKNERKLLLNELYLSAGKAYWDWFSTYNIKLVFEDAYRLANERLQAVKQGVEAGDRPSIDTIEANIQVQNRLLGLQEATLNFKNSTNYLSIFLWANGLIPLEVDTITVPQKLDSSYQIIFENIFNENIDSLVNFHPGLKNSSFKIDQLKVDKQLKKEQLKPTFNLKYNFINEPVGGNPFNEFNVNNYKWGLEFNLPIFLRKERGDLKLAELKMKDQQLELSTKTVKLKNEILNSINEWETTKNQFKLYQKTVLDYYSLLSGEKQMFEAGETSLFLVNRRELGFINAEIKLIQLYSKNQFYRIMTFYNMGVLFEEYSN